MKKGWLARAAAGAAVASGIALSGALLGCPSQTEKMDMGDAVDDEVATPTDPAEMQMTEEQRRAAEAAQEEAAERQELDESGQGDNAPTPP
jgi:hypothetical protein